MYLSTSPTDPEPIAVKALSDRAGLYIHPRQAPGTPRAGAMKVSIPADCLGTSVPVRLRLTYSDLSHYFLTNHRYTLVSFEFTSIHDIKTYDG